MVRNNGGNKAKKFASKAFSVSEKTTRFSTDKDEVYATVNRMLGSNICEVLCVDGKIRLCIIRGKFSGKGRRDNRLCRGKWVLVGLRGWELTSKEKQKCDLLEVYSDNDKEKLIKNSRENFRVFLSVSEDDHIDHDHVQFINDREEELFESKIGRDEGDDEDDEDEEGEDGEEGADGEERDNKSKDIISITKQMDWVDIDDI